LRHEDPLEADSQVEEELLVARPEEEELVNSIPEGVEEAETTSPDVAGSPSSEGGLQYD
jgi:hypothetical protein